MWKNTRMIILVAVCSAIYGAALIAFKTTIPLIPGITEVRVANIFPMVFSLLFGPAGAWGSAIGNLIGDLFGGTLGPGSFPGFVGNFLLGYLPYALWTTLLPFSGGSREWKPESWRCWINYGLIAFISSTACAVVIGISIDTLGIVPYAVLTKIIAVNNTFASLIGLILLTSVFNVTRQQLGLFWADVIEEEDSRPSPFAPIGAWIVAAASLFGLMGGMMTSLPTAVIGWASALAIIAGSLLL
jgi:energy-coupling factor transport system substrate-specific component